MTEELFNIIFGIFWAIILCIWLYCIWFANRYDKNSNSIIWLFVLNVFYIPYYLWRIKQIKFETKIREENQNRLTDDSFSEEDFISQNRNNIIDVLKLWASKAEQFEKKKSEPEINISQELFLQWNDCYKIDNNILKQAFSSKELELFAQFDEIIQNNFGKFENNNFKESDFLETKEWQELNLISIGILTKMNEK